MKLYIADSIRHLRQSIGLTQEQLAERLGVSYQSVSRWEGGSSYPDIELIPEIAAFFEVTTDVLMGVEKATMEKKLADDKKHLRNHDFESAEERLAFIEDMHARYPHDADTMIHLIYALSAYPKRLEDMKRLIGDYMNHPSAEKVYIDQCIRLLISAEKEEKLPELLEKYAAEEDMSRSSLLAYRAWDRDDSENRRKYRQYTALTSLYDFFTQTFGRPFSTDAFIYSPEAENAVRRQLALINLLTGTDNLNIVSGDGELDLWYSERIALGFHLAGNCALGGRCDEALDVLESAVSLAEKFYSMPEGTRLDFRCPELSELYAVFSYGVRNPDDVFDFTENLHRCMREEGTFFGVDMKYIRRNGEEEYDHNVECAAWDIIPLTDTEEWSCFDGIRDDERFKGFVRRMEKFVIPVNGNK